MFYLQVQRATAKADGSARVGIQRDVHAASQRQSNHRLGGRDRLGQDDTDPAVVSSITRNCKRETFGRVGYNTGNIEQ